MSNTSSENRGSGQRRRRSRGGRNRNRNRNQQGNRPQGEQRQGGNRQGGNRQGGRQGNSGQGRRRRSAPKPKPLTWWQKLLKAIGLYKEPARPQRGGKTAPKSNTRNARSDAEPKPKKERKPREPREPKKPRQPVSTEDVTTKRVYLGNLSYEATESDLEELFRGVGTVRRVEIVYNRRTHRSKGYGFVEMLNVDEAKRAVEILHDQFFMGRKLTVDGAKSQGPAAGDAEPEEGVEDDAPTPEESQPPAEPQQESEIKPS